MLFVRRRREREVMRTLFGVVVACAVSVASQEFDAKPVEGVIRLPPQAATLGQPAILPSTKV